MGVTTTLPGNPTTYQFPGFTYDPGNRMTAAGSSLTCGYNGDGLRAWKQNSSGRTYFLYDGEEPVCELNSSGSVTATNTFGADGLVSRHASGSSVFYVFDLRGCLAERVNSSGGVLSTHYMDANGGGPNEVSSDPWSGPWSQWGGYTDMETGWTLCSHRYYVGQGRWLTRDPMGYGGGVNLYGYCTNDPVNVADGSGLVPTPDQGCKEAATVRAAITKACAMINAMVPTATNNLGAGITPGEKKCLQNLCRSNIIIRCGSPNCASTPGLLGEHYDPILFGNGTIIICTGRDGNPTNFEPGITSAINNLALVLIHEMLHECKRGDNGGPPLPGTGGQPSNPADDGARSCMGLGAPYKKGY